MSLLTDRSNLRTKLKIDPNGRIWNNDTLDRFLNEGQRWLINDPAVAWEFQETVGYLVPVSGFQEYRQSTVDNPENFASPRSKQFTRFQDNKGIMISMDNLFAKSATGPYAKNTVTSSPSMVMEYAQRLFFNVGLDASAVYTTIHNMDSFDGNGTWLGTNYATNVATETTNFKEGLGAVSFDIDTSVNSSNRATLTNTTIAPVDLSAFNVDQRGIILWVYLPAGVDLKAVNLCFGSTPVDFYNMQNFQQANGLEFKEANDDSPGQEGWNRIFLPTVERQISGDPDFSAVTYVKLDLFFDADQGDVTGVIVDNIQFVDKFFRYFYTLSSENLTEDGDESVVPEQYRFIYGLYAEYKCWSELAGREKKAQQALDEAQFQRNVMIEELNYKTTHPSFGMPDRRDC